MNRRESVEFVNMCMIKNGDKVLVKIKLVLTGLALLFLAAMLNVASPLSMLSFVKWRKKLVLPFLNLNSVVSKIGMMMQIIAMSSSYTKLNTLLVSSNLQTKEKSGGKILKIYLISNWLLRICLICFVFFWKNTSVSSFTIRIGKTGLTNSNNSKSAEVSPPIFSLSNLQARSVSSN